MDTSSDNAIKGFAAQSRVSDLLRSILPSNFEVVDNRSFILGKQSVGIGIDNNINFEEKKMGDIGIWRNSKGMFVKIEVCCGGPTGVSIGESKANHFQGTHYCFVIPDKDVSGDPFRQKYSDIVFAPRDIIAKYLGTMELRESKFGSEKYRWLKTENVRGLRCGMTMEKFTDLLKD